MTRRELADAIDAYVRERTDQADAEVRELRAKVRDLEARLAERSVREASGASVDLTDLRRVVRGYDNSRSHQAKPNQSLQERIARELLARMSRETP